MLLTVLLNNSMDRNLDYLNENTQFHEDIIKLRKENVEFRNSNNEFSRENYRLKDTNTKLDKENIEIKSDYVNLGIKHKKLLADNNKLNEDYMKLGLTSKELFAENDLLREANSKYVKQIEILQTKVECQESFVRGSNMEYEALSVCNPSLFKPDVPASTTVIVEEVEDKPKNKLKIT
jgi:hypothetical protein